MQRLILSAISDPELYTFSWETTKGIDYKLTRLPQVRDYVRIIDKKGRTIEIINFPLIIGRYSNVKDNASVMIHDGQGHVSRKQALLQLIQKDGEQRIGIIDLKSGWETRIYRKAQKIPLSTTTPELLEDGDILELAYKSPHRDPVKLLVKFEQQQPTFWNKIKKLFS